MFAAQDFGEVTIARLDCLIPGDIRAVSIFTGDREQYTIAIGRSTPNG